jgi:hypothetical protein
VATVLHWCGWDVVNPTKNLCLRARLLPSFRSHFLILRDFLFSCLAHYFVPPAPSLRILVFPDAGAVPFISSAMSAAAPDPPPSPPGPPSPPPSPRPTLPPGVLRAPRGTYVTSVEGRTRYYTHYSPPLLDHEIQYDDDNNLFNLEEVEDTYSIAWSERTTSFSWIYDISAFDEEVGGYEDPRRYGLYHTRDFFNHSCDVEGVINEGITSVETRMTAAFDQLEAAASHGDSARALAVARAELAAVLLALRATVTAEFSNHRDLM